MSNDDAGARSSAQEKQTATRSIFSIPPPLKRLFDRFPFTVYPQNEPPVRASRDENEHQLYIFTTFEEARDGKPSYNPSCLKWQAYMRFAGLQPRVVPSNNHASPSGSLPFVLPAKSDKAVASNALRKWVAEHSEKQPKEPEDVRYEAYASLISDSIRRAWLYQLYLLPSNSALVHRLYVATCSSNALVQFTIHHQLRTAAEAELENSSSSTTAAPSRGTDLLKEAEDALHALSSALGSDDWFFEASSASLFDASVFAYTHLLLDERALKWEENRLGDMIRQHDNLVRHAERIRDMYF